MNILMIVKVAVRAIWRNKTRSALTMLGIIFGIAAVIMVLAIGKGASANMVAQISKMGDNVVMIFSEQRHAAAGVHGGAGEGQSLTASDGIAIRRELAHLVKAESPEVRTQMQVVCGDKNWNTTIYGCSTEFLVIRNWDMASGDFFNEQEERQCARVCVLGKTVASNLFPNEDPAGRTLRIGNMPFKVKGVLEAKGVGGWGQDQDDAVLAPYTTVKRVLQASTFPDNVRQLKLSLWSMDQIEEAKREIGALLRQRHRLSENAEDDFRIIDMAEITSTMSGVSNTMTVLLAAVAAISLLVGGIGIMNIMLVSVTERIREIGLRMAIGATPANILSQFILEAVLLSTVGGGVGVAIGVSGAQAIGEMLGWPILVETASTAVAFLFSAFVGMFFGFYPAWRASRLNPIDCLRYE
ncbi:MAG: ABC transporter permease [Kiritimatiellae bacterium]|nr:ABC transporter permease [Kiritimatiellia bacterium]